MTRIFTKKRRPAIEAIGQIFIALSLLAAVSYGVGFYPSGMMAASLSAYPMAALVKTAAIGFLTLFALMNAKRGDIIFLVFALAAGAAGDFLITGTTNISLMNAIFAFGIGHIFYIFLFMFNFCRVKELSLMRLKLTALLWAGAGFGVFYLWPQLVNQPLALLVYMGLLLVMASMALLSRYPIFLTGLGGVLFLVSDVFLGLGLILQIDLWTTHLVWPLYYVGQFMLCMGIILSPAKDSRMGGYRF